MARNAKKSPTKAQIYGRIAEDTGLTRKDIAAVFDSLNDQIRTSLNGRSAPGAFTIPGLLKLHVVSRPARKARKAINNFTGEEYTVEARPASRAVKACPLKALRDMVSR